MNVFWKSEPLTEHQVKLLDACLTAHAKSALRENISSVVLCQAAQGNGSLPQSIAAALNTLGGKHAPIHETWDFLSLDFSEVWPERPKYPGWGNSFFKGEPDPLWKEVDEILMKSFTDQWGRLSYVTTQVRSRGKNIYPNPSAYTVAVAKALDMPKELAPWLFISGRLNAWSALFIGQLNKKE